MRDLFTIRVSECNLPCCGTYDSTASVGGALCGSRRARCSTAANVRGASHRAELTPSDGGALRLGNPEVRGYGLHQEPPRRCCHGNRSEPCTLSRTGDTVQSVGPRCNWLVRH